MSNNKAEKYQVYSISKRNVKFPPRNWRQMEKRLHKGEKVIIIRGARLQDSVRSFQRSTGFESEKIEGETR